MKKIDVNPEDTLRPEYKRSDFSELVRGKYATTKVDFQQLCAIFLGCIGEEEGVDFVHYAKGNRLSGHQAGDWTYEIDNGNQVTLKYWLNEFGGIEEAITNPPVVMTSKERTELQNALSKGVMNLKSKIAVGKR